MKKRIFIFCIAVVLSLSTIILCACNKKDTVAITIHSGQEVFKIEKAKGENLNDFDADSLYEGETSIGAPIRHGLFYDESCLFKYDQSQPLENDIKLYAGVYQANANTVSIRFVFEENEYFLYQQYNYPLTTFDFISTAYGKSISPACLEFYSDEDMTNRFDLVGLNYQTECKREHVFLLYGKYTIYVKRVPAPPLPTYVQ